MSRPTTALRTALSARAAVPVLAIAVVALLAGGLATLHDRGVSTYVVASGSMAPALPAGAAIVTVPASSYAVGDVITYRAGGGVVTHRVVEVMSDGGLVTRGEANDARDPGAVSPAAVEGRVALTVPLLGVALVFIQQPTTLPALVLLVVLVALLRSMVVAARAPRVGEGIGCTGSAL